MSSSQNTSTQQNLYNKSYIENSECSVNMMSNSEYSYDMIYMKFKVILLGDVGVGKTAIFERFTKAQDIEDYKSTININVDIKQFNIDNNTLVEMEIFDTMGQERFRSITRNYIHGAKGIIILYSIVDKMSFKVLQEWINMVNDVIDIKEVTIYIVGNKLDREEERTVTFEEAESFAKKQNFSYYEVSAKLGMNIDILFEKIARDISNKMFEEGDRSQFNKIHMNSSKGNISHSLTQGTALPKINAKQKKQNVKRPYEPSEARCC